MSNNGNGSTGTGTNGIGDEFAKAKAPESIDEWRYTKVQRKHKRTFVNFCPTDSIYFVCRDDGIEDGNSS